MSLSIDIHKRLPYFDLKVAFEAQSETVGLLGASGSGKSMTLRCIAGLVTPDSGHVVVNGTTFFDSGRGINLSPQQRKTALLFQRYQLFPTMTVAENIAAGIDRSIRQEERERLVSELLGFFHISGQDCPGGSSSVSRSPACLRHARASSCLMSPSPRSTST